jgi:hypothetical protein
LFVKKATDDIHILLDIARPNEDTFPPNFILVRKILKTTKTYKDKYNGGSEEPMETTSQVEEGFETKSQINYQDVPTLESLQFSEILDDATYRSSKALEICTSTNILKRNLSLTIVVIVVAVLLFLVPPKTLNWNRVMVS